MNEKLMRVLAIGDPDVLSIVRSQLAGPDECGASFQLETAERLSSGCLLIDRRDFDAIVLDLMLPQSVGIEGFRKVASLKPATAIMVLAAVRDKALAEEALALGAQDYLFRGSLERSTLRRTIVSAVEKQSLANQLERLLADDAAGRVVVDESGGVLYANASAGALLGGKAEELIGRAFPHRLSSSEPCEIEASLGDDGPRLAERRVDPLPWRGRPARLVTLRDVTELRRLRKLEAEHHERLRAAEIKSQFMSRVSHELRNALATVKTAVFCLNEGETPLSPRQNQLVGMISRNVDRQVRIIENILDISRLQSGQLRIARKPIRLASVVQEVSREFRLTKKPRRVNAELAEDLPDVHADPDLLVQVLRNLLDNAFRYARAKVRIEAAAEGSEVAVSVVDDGAGIPSERLGQLFRQYVQLDRPSGGRGYKGTGLGLAICKEIIEAHGGRIWAESVPGEGARFRFTLPVTSPSPRIDAAKMASVRPAGL